MATLGSTPPDNHASAAPPWRAALLASTAVGAVSAAQTTVLLTMRGEAPPTWRVVVFGLAQWWTWGCVAALLWRHVQHTAPRWQQWRAFVLRHLPLAVLNSLARAVLLSAVARPLLDTRGSSGPSLLAWAGSYLVTRSVVDVTIYFAIAAAALLWQDRRRAAVQEQRTAALAAQLAQAELRALRMQLQPHFLFNTLHAITVLITEQPARARRMLVLLGDLLRSTLVADGEPEVPLARELEFARRYLEIEAVRFEERLAVAFDVPEELMDAAVPNFVLQPLVENAVAHGVGRSVRPCTVRVSAAQDGSQLVLDVWNDGTVVPVPERTGVGLATTRERLARLYGSAGTCTLDQVDAGVRARVTMPYRRSADVR